MSDGRVVINSITPFAGDLFTSDGNAGDWAINGYSTTNGVGSYGQNTGTGYGVYGAGVSGYGVVGRNFTATGTGIIAIGNAIALISPLASGSGIASFGANVGSFSTASGAGGVGSYGYVNQIDGFGVIGQNDNVSGTGIMGTGNGEGGIMLTNGSGGSFTGSRIGIVGFVGSDSTSAGNLRAGGYFYTNSTAWAYVGVETAAGTSRKIEGPGTVNTVVKDTEGNQVLLSAPEAPENLFEDYGYGELYNGKATIVIDPIFAKNIVVNKEHPLRVFIQLEGQCNGVYVTNKTGTGFEVVELSKGNSNVNFMWHIVANRADEVLADGSVAKYSSERFAPSIGAMKAKKQNNELLKKQTQQKVIDCTKQNDKEKSRN
jgi:hypothetical protein